MFSTFSNYDNRQGKFTLMNLPYSSIEKFFSKETIDYHYGKHHNGYVNKLNDLMQNEKYKDISQNVIPTEISTFGIMNATFNSKVVNGFANSLFNNAAQIWNHDFFWNCFAENKNGVSDDSIKTSQINSVSEGGNDMNSGLMNAINSSFGSFEKFKSAFFDAATAHFGSGWCWLLQHVDSDTLIVQCTTNAENPMMNGLVPLFVCDLWEHAYYIDYRNNRAQYIKDMWNFVNWKFVSENFNSEHLKSCVASVNSFKV